VPTIIVAVGTLRFCPAYESIASVRILAAQCARAWRWGLLRTKGAQMHEVRYALPAATSSRDNGVVRKARLTKRFDQESGFLQRHEIGLQRTMLAIERHRQAVALDRIGVMESMKIVAFDDEVRVGGRFFEAPGRVDWMDYRQAKPATWFQNARSFLNGSRHPADILKRHEGDRQIRARIIKRKRGGIRQTHVHRWVGLSGGGDERRRTVDANDTVPAFLQVARETSLAAPDIQSLPSRRRQESKKLVAVKPPITVVSGSARPLNPLARLSLPADT
jgi:hypothetical protein